MPIISCLWRKAEESATLRICAPYALFAIGSKLLNCGAGSAVFTYRSSNGTGEKKRAFDF
jgi:hypothetical protein